MGNEPRFSFTKVAYYKIFFSFIASLFSLIYSHVACYAFMPAGLAFKLSLKIFLGKRPRNSGFLLYLPKKNFQPTS